MINFKKILDVLNIYAILSAKRTNGPARASGAPQSEPLPAPKPADVSRPSVEPIPKWEILSEVVQDIPRGAAHRRWTLRADNQAHHHGIVRLSESPLFLELHWRPTAVDAVRPVGVFRLDLNGLLRGGYIRYEPVGSHGSDVRVRIVRDDDGSFYVETKQDEPRLLLASRAT